MESEKDRVEKGETPVRGPDGIVDKNLGGTTGTRTRNTLVKSQLLCQLSYDSIE